MYTYTTVKKKQEKFKRNEELSQKVGIWNSNSGHFLIRNSYVNHPAEIDKKEDDNAKKIKYLLYKIINNL